MAASSMQVEVVSAEAHVLSAEVSELYARSVSGEIGILPGHQPAVIALDIAPVKLRLADGTEERIAVHRGILYVGRDQTIVLADIAERAGDIDRRRAETAKRDDEARLEREDDAGVRASLARQDLRLDVSGR